MPTENKIEKDLNPEEVMDLNSQMYKLEMLKWGEISKYFSNQKNQKTQITKEERIIFPLMEMIAEKPFSISQKIKNNKDDNPYWIPKNQDKNNYKIDVMRVFLDNYYELGICVDRQGRTEEKEVLKAALGTTTMMNPEDMKKPENVLLK